MSADWDKMAILILFLHRMLMMLLHGTKIMEQVPFLFSMILLQAQMAHSQFRIGDLDNDGDLDIVSASYHDDAIAWYENNGASDPSFSAADIATRQIQVYLGDLDSDGDLDIVSSSYNDDTIAWYENDGGSDPSFSAANIFTNIDGAWAVSLKDLDNDGDLDIISGSFLDDAIYWHENNGAADPTFNSTNITTVADGIRFVHAVDLDLDGDQDVLSASE